MDAVTPATTIITSQGTTVLNQLFASTFTVKIICPYHNLQKLDDSIELFIKY
jgi:hypothetical protein